MVVQEIVEYAAQTAIGAGAAAGRGMRGALPSSTTGQAVIASLFGITGLWLLFGGGGAVRKLVALAALGGSAYIAWGLRGLR